MPTQCGVVSHRAGGIANPLVAIRFPNHPVLTD